MIDMKKYQKEIDNLQKHFNKKARSLDEKDLVIIRCALGANEEAGEIAHVVLKNITGHYGFDDVEKMKEKVTDAVVDMLVFGLQILNEIDVDFEKAFPAILESVIERNKLGKKHIPIQK